MSGENVCPPQSFCSFGPKTCHGEFLGHVGSATSLNKCREECQKNPKCNWVNFKNGNSCHLLSDCQYLTDCENCETSRADCVANVDEGKNVFINNYTT